MSESTDMNNIILLVGKHGRINGRTRFQKIIFLLKAKHRIQFSFDFTPYYYGPYSYDLSEYIESLVSYGLLIEQRTRLSNDIDRYDYELTKKGKELLEGIQSSGLSESLKALEKSARSIKDTPTPKLVTEAKQIMALSMATS